MLEALPVKVVVLGVAVAAGALGEC